MEDQLFKSHSQQNKYVFIYNVISKRMLPFNHLSISIFKFQLKILFKKFPQQRAGYHQVHTIQVYSLYIVKYKCTPSIL